MKMLLLYTLAFKTNKHMTESLKERTVLHQVFVNDMVLRMLKSHMM